MKIFIVSVLVHSSATANNCYEVISALFDVDDQFPVHLFMRLLK